MPCDRTIQIDAYYDGALRDAQRAEFEAHLAGCDECRRGLDDLRRVSRILSGATLPEISEALPKRVIASFAAARKQTQERGLRRLAGWLTAAAAAVLLVAILRFSISMRIANDATVVDSGAREWELAAVMPPPDRTPDDAGSAEFVQLAQWMARDLAASGEGRR